MPRTKEKGSTRSYFKTLFEANPAWLKSKSNEEAYAKWHADHPGKQLTASIKSGISNIKSELRTSRRRSSSKGKRKAVASISTRGSRPSQTLNNLEIMIDDAVLLAYQHDAPGLSKVIEHLRLARNKVILAIGSDD